ncbi:MAG: DUF222 domain-containing protein [Propionicimonas sp.]|uniref:HNH endonuclease signature motif containing protein n=1 Tax=Propionicimonas sp. TaxID=1955623 RepID=UPI003D0C3F82
MPGAREWASAGKEMSVAVCSVVVMEMGFEQYADGDLVAVMNAALDALTDDRVRLAGDREQLDLLEAAVRLGARLHAWQVGVAAHVEAGEVAWREYGTSTSTWLADRLNLTRREAGRIITAGQGLARFDTVAQAARAGVVLPGQAEAITGVLDLLPDELPVESVQEAQELMVGFAGSHNSAELRRLTHHLVEVLDPAGADAREAERLEQEHTLAVRNRHLSFTHDGHGQVWFRGSLPVAEAEPWIQILDAYAAQAKRGLDRLDPLAEHVTAAMWRADALLAMVHQHTQNALAPAHGGDRPRITLTVSYDTLAKTAIDHGFPAGQLVGSGEPVAASVLRQWLCDADLLPVVLGGPSEVLDVGRTQRLVTPEIRVALEQRDAGCVFPGCDKPPRDCHAHHLTPWWVGGTTALHNLALLCPHHHGIVEPGHDPTADRWTIRLRADGVSEILLPKRVDPNRKPRTHNRFHLKC